MAPTGSMVTNSSRGEVQLRQPRLACVLLGRRLDLGGELRVEVLFPLDGRDPALQLVDGRVARLQHPSTHPHLLVSRNARHPRVTRVLILLPPSEGKATARRGAPLDLARLSSPELTAAREAGARRPWRSSAARTPSAR